MQQQGPLGSERPLALPWRERAPACTSSGSVEGRIEDHLLVARVAPSAFQWFPPSDPPIVHLERLNEEEADTRPVTGFSDEEWLRLSVIAGPQHVEYEEKASGASTAGVLRDRAGKHGWRRTLLARGNGDSKGSVLRACMTRPIVNAADARREIGAFRYRAREIDAAFFEKIVRET